MRLYFFPALLPLASLLPALLALIGAAAAAIQSLRHRRIAALRLTRFAVAALLVALGLQLVKEIRKNRLPSLAPVERLPAQDTTGEWSQLLPRAALSDLTYSDRHGLVLFGTRQGTLEAISVRDGTPVFSLALAEPVLSKPLIAGDRAYIGEGLHDATRARLVALRLPDGQALWQQRFDGHLEASPRLSPDGQTLFGCAGDAGAYAVEAATGKLLWRTALGHCDTTPWFEPAGNSGENTVFFLVASLNARSALVALDPRSGQVRWKTTLPGQPWGTLERDPASGNLLATTGLGQLGPEVQAGETGWSHSITLKWRAVAWSRKLPGIALTSSPLVELPGRDSARQVLHTLKKGELHALDATKGNEYWRLKLPGPILSSSRQLPGSPLLLALGYDGTLFWIETVSGKIAARRYLSGESSSAPAFSSAHVFFATRSELRAIPLRGAGVPQISP
ncbi:MAG: PQQ-like beta-propeller repeat protein [Oligoflexia bacterium]|nr:PQQ-like beta-propeller repeat protein [Oligoflexia bacterium]